MAIKKSRSEKHVNKTMLRERPNSLSREIHHQKHMKQLVDQQKGSCAGVQRTSSVAPVSGLLALSGLLWKSPLLLLNVLLELLSPPWTSHVESVLVCVSSGPFSLLAPTHSSPAQGDCGGRRNRRLSFQQ